MPDYSDLGQPSFRPPKVGHPKLGPSKLLLRRKALRESLSIASGGVSGRCETKPKYQPVIAVDFSGRICDITGLPHHIHHHLDNLGPRPGTKEAMEAFYDSGAKVVVWTSHEDLEEVEDWLDEYQIPYHYINEDPDQPEDSRKIEADVYLDDRGEGNPNAPWPQLVSLTLHRIRNDLNEWKKQPKHGTVQHIIITGHSGAGKTTLSKLLAEKTGMPVWKVDQDKLWKVSKPFRDTLGRYPSLDWFDGKDKPHGMEKMIKKYRKILKKLVRNALNKSTPTILEGCHFLVCPGTLRGHRIVLLDAPEHVVISQRLNRDREEGKLKEDNSNIKEREEKARFLYNKLQPAVERMKDLDGIEILQSHQIPHWVDNIVREMEWKGSRCGSKAISNLVNPNRQPTPEVGDPVRVTRTDQYGRVERTPFPEAPSYRVRYGDGEEWSVEQPEHVRVETPPSQSEEEVFSEIEKYENKRIKAPRVKPGRLHSKKEKSLNCPECGSKAHTDTEGRVWCTNPPCRWGLCAFPEELANSDLKSSQVSRGKALLERYATKNGESLRSDLDSQGGYKPVSLDLVDKADFITLPQGITGTNCGNCSFIKDGICTHPKLNNQPVNNHNCCLFWDAPGTMRGGEVIKQSQKAMTYLGESGGGALVSPAQMAIGKGREKSNKRRKAIPHPEDPNRPPTPEVGDPVRRVSGKERTPIGYGRVVDEHYGPGGERRYTVRKQGSARSYMVGPTEEFEVGTPPSQSEKEVFEDIERVEREGYRGKALGEGVITKLQRVANSFRNIEGLGPDYQRLFFHPDSGVAWWESFDGDEEEPIREVINRLESVEGVSKVRVEAEYSPPMDEGWILVFPELKEWNTPRRVEKPAYSGRRKEEAEAPPEETEEEIPPQQAPTRPEEQHYFTGVKIDHLGRRNCYVRGRRVPCTGAPQKSLPPSREPDHELYLRDKNTGRIVPRPQNVEMQDHPPQGYSGPSHLSENEPDVLGNKAISDPVDPNRQPTPEVGDPVRRVRGGKPTEQYGQVISDDPTYRERYLVETEEPGVDWSYESEEGIQVATPPTPGQERVFEDIERYENKKIRSPRINPVSPFKRRKALLVGARENQDDQNQRKVVEQEIGK